VDRDTLACDADARSPFDYDNASVLGNHRPWPIRLQCSEGREPSSSPSAGGSCSAAWPLPELGRHGLNLVGHPPLMLRLPGPVPVPQPPGLRIVAVDDAKTCRDFERVLKDGFGLPKNPVVTDRRLLGQSLHLLVGYLDNRPITTAAQPPARSKWTGWQTLPAQRRRGIGAAMTAAALSVEPSWPAVLLASDDGHDLYHRLGFIDLLRLTIWEHQPQPDTERQ
jgi:hypothetical protein